MLWGSVRADDDADDLLTDYTYTGQRSEAALGLMYYVARWYDVEIGHFVQADTIVPGAGNPAAYNRFSYLYYNPINHIDPSGHWACDDLSDPSCAETGSELAQFYQGQGLLDANFDTSILPDWIPTRNQDLFLAYVYLFTQTTEIQYGPGGQFTTSGLELGMFIAENQIEISFSSLCSGSACVFANDQNIYINENRMNGGPDGDLLDLVRSISHETFHKTDPFNQGRNSQYEEMWARHISSVIINDPSIMITQANLDSALNQQTLDVILASEYNSPKNPYSHLAPYPAPAYEILSNYYFNPPISTMED
jgi:RHS repeat-associated protein